MVPPLLWDALRGRFGNRFEGEFASWAEAKAACVGYEDASIVQRVAEAARAVERGEAAYEQDSVLFDEVHYSWPVVASLLMIACARGGSLSVVDFGGSLGTSYRQNRKLLKGLQRLSWAVVEQETFVAAGQAEFSTPTLQFFGDLDPAIERTRADVILLSGVLQYLPDPQAFLGELVDKPVEYLLFDRTPLIDGETDRLTVQRVPRHIYPASYPAWFLSRKQLWSKLERQFELVEKFSSKDAANIRSEYGGSLWKRR